MLVTGISNLKNIPFSIFSGGHIFKALIDLMVCQFYTLPPDRLFLNFAYKYVLIQAINLPNKKYVSSLLPSR